MRRKKVPTDAETRFGLCISFSKIIPGIPGSEEFNILGKRKTGSFELVTSLPPLPKSALGPHLETLCEHAERMYFNDIPHGCKAYVDLSNLEIDEDGAFDISALYETESDSVLIHLIQHERLHLLSAYFIPD
ncbi:MAG TPA: hypothetical protein VLA04_02025 [Verrucomicrobiae bacterium]|nr:hypothetical protein [Verrucomicrobiae bacterium]